MVANKILNAKIKGGIVPKHIFSRSLLVSAATIALFSATAIAQNFDIPSGNLEAALDAYSAQSGVALMVPNGAVQGIPFRGLKGDLPPTEALSRILKGTGFSASRDTSGVVAIVRVNPRAKISGPCLCRSRKPCLFRTLWKRSP